MPRTKAAPAKKVAAKKKVAPAAKKAAPKRKPVGMPDPTIKITSVSITDTEAIDLFADSNEDAVQGRTGQVAAIPGGVNPDDHDRPLLLLTVKRLSPDALLPKLATEGAACFDLHTVEEGPLLARQARGFATGIAVEVPPGYALMIYSRSGHGFKNGVRLANSVGVIDSDYRGEIAVKLHNDSGDLFIVRKGDRVAQAMLVPVPRVSLFEVEELGETQRGASGFGSTGA